MFPLTLVRFEPHNDNSDADCPAEGIAPIYVRGLDRPCYGVGIDDRYDSPRAAFAALWDSVNGPGAWARNDWVCVFGWEWKVTNPRGSRPPRPPQVRLPAAQRRSPRSS